MAAVHDERYGKTRLGLVAAASAADIAPYITFSGTLAMAITRDGSSLATTQNLLKDCHIFGYEPDESRQYIEHAKAIVAQGWARELEQCGYPGDLMPPPDFEWLGT